jgi:hypothetical protein
MWDGVTYRMGTKCKTGRQRQTLRDALREVHTNGFAWVNRDGYRLKLIAPYLPGEGQCVDALVRNGNKVEQQTIVGKDAGCRLRVYNGGRRGNPSMVLATIDERHPIEGAKQNGHWGTSTRDRYPGFPRTRPEGVGP